MARARDILRSGTWLTRERVRLIAAAILIASVAGFLYLVVTANGLVDTQGRPLGTDFSSFYAAGTYVLDGDPEAPFDIARQQAREQDIFGAATPSLRLVLSAVLSRARRRPGADALWAGACGLAGGHARPLSPGDPGDPHSRPAAFCRRPRASRQTDRRSPLAPRRARLPGRADQYRPWPERLPHRRPPRCGAPQAQPPAAPRRRLVRSPGVQAAVRIDDPDRARRGRTMAHFRCSGRNGRRPRGRDHARLRSAGVVGVLRFGPPRPPRGRTRRRRLVQDAERFRLGANVACADPARLCAAERRDCGDGRRARLAVARPRVLSGEGGGALPRRHSGNALRGRITT